MKIIILRGIATCAALGAAYLRYQDGATFDVGLLLILATWAGLWTWDAVLATRDEREHA